MLSQLVSHLATRAIGTDEQHDVDEGLRTVRLGSYSWPRCYQQDLLSNQHTGLGKMTTAKVGTTTNRFALTRENFEKYSDRNRWIPFGSTGNGSSSARRVRYDRNAPNYFFCSSYGKPTETLRQLFGSSANYQQNRNQISSDS